MNKKLSPQRKATFVSSCTAFALMVMKFAVGIFSGSIAVLSSAVDSLMDLFVSLFNNFAVWLAEKRPNREFNYGRGKIEAMAAFFEGLIITASGSYIFYESIKKIISGEEVEHIGISVIVMLISVSVTFFLVKYLYSVAKKTENLVIQSDGLHYKTDLLTNGGVLIGLVIIYFTNFYLIDSIIGILVSIYIVTEAFELIKKGFLLLMDVSLSSDDIEKIKEIIKSQDKVKRYYDLKTRQSGNIKFVEVNVIVSECMILVEADKIACEIEKQIKNIDKKYEWDITIHMDPYNTEIKEENE